MRDVCHQTVKLRTGHVYQRTMVAALEVDVAKALEAVVHHGLRAIAKQAEAERLRRAKIIDAEGEFQAAER